MSGIISYILVIVMAFSSLGGLTANVEGTVSFDTKIGVDAETILALAGADAAGEAEEAQQTMKVVGDVMDVLTLKGTATKDTAELALLAKEDVVLSLGLKQTEEGATFASNLLGSQTIFFSPEMLEQLQQQMALSMTAGVDASALEQLQNLDKEQIEKDAAEIGEKLTQAIEAKKGETETGEFTVDGMTFTSRAPIKMTFAEFTELLLGGAKELAGKESLKPVLQASGQDIEAQIDKAIEDIRKQEDQPEFGLTAYTDADNCTYYVSNATKAAQDENGQGEKVYIAYGEVDSLTRCRIDMDAKNQKSDITFTGKKEGTYDLKAVIGSEAGDGEITVTGDETGKIDMVADVKSEQTTGKLVLKTEPVEGERTAFSFEVFMGDADKALLSLTGSAGKGGELLSVFEGEKITAVPVEQLMDESSTDSQKLAMTLTASALKAITTLTKNLPEDTAAWLNKQIMQMMTPQTTTTVPKSDGE